MPFDLLTVLFTRLDVEVNGFNGGVLNGVPSFSDERPSSRFRGITLPSKRRRLRYSTVGLTRYRTR